MSRRRHIAFELRIYFIPAIYYMRELRSEITIEADAETIWAVLTDTVSYPEWNPFITRIDGELAVGNKLRVRIEPPGGTPMTFRPTCLERTNGRRLRWLGSLGIKGIFDGEHIFELESIGVGKTRLTQRENFSGLLVPLLWRSVAPNTLRGFEAMNLKLKSRAEEKRVEVGIQ
jgi:hypothetical protein